MRLVDIAENPVPPGAAVSLVRAGRLDLRVARWTPAPRAGARCPGTVVVCPGRGEFIEKYAEVVGDLLARGFAVVAFDWRGQGGSSRLLHNPRKGYVKSFAHYERDLAALGSFVLAPFCPRPWFALAHSMGGAILLHHASRVDCLFDRVVLSAPMIDLHGLRAPTAVRAAAALATALGWGSAYVPGGRDRSVMAQPFPGNVLTSDPNRYAAFAALVRAAPDLTVGGPTFGWVHAAFQAMARFLDPEFPRRIVVPILVVACGGDRVVDTRAVERFASRLKAGRLIVVPHAEHEILMEQNRYREQFWAAFDAFVPGTLAEPERPEPSVPEPRRNFIGSAARGLDLRRG